MPFDPKYPELRRRRFRPIPVRMLVPNMITLLAICAGLTAIRLSTEGRMELAVAAIVFAAVLDGLDGRVARMIKGQSKFGAELDSLADFVNFGVAPGLILYFWQLHDLNNGGWIAAMVFAISGGLRLARRCTTEPQSVTCRSTFMPTCCSMSVKSASRFWRAAILPGSSGCWHRSRSDSRRHARTSSLEPLPTLAHVPGTNPKRPLAAGGPDSRDTIALGSTHS